MDEKLAAETLPTLGGEGDARASLGDTVALDPSGAATLAAPKAPALLEEATQVTLEDPGRYFLKGGRPEAAEIGRGGIGRVLVAHDSHLGREIAVKELLTESADESDMATPVSWTAAMAARFLREARVTGQLEHPNIVPVYELGRRADGTLYYTMKLVRGRTLAAALRQAGDLRGRLRLLPHYVDLCQAIAYAHSRGVIHRDVKTENAMLGEFGETVVLDWGLAKVRGKADIRGREIEREVRELKGGEAGRTVDGSAIGTPAYMPPEQAEGRIDAIDERSDVWSLGAVLYEVLTGRPPFGGSTPVEVMEKVANEPIVLPRAVDPAIPAELEAVAMKALSRDKEKRYESAKRMAKEIEAFLTGGRVGAYEYGSFELLKRAVKKNKALSLAVLAVFLVTVAGLLLVWRMYDGAETARAEAQRNARRAEAGEAAARDKEAGAIANLSQAWIEMGKKHEDAQRWLEARVSYLRSAELGAREAARDGLYRIAALSGEYVPNRRLPAVYSHRYTDSAISEDGTVIAYGDPSGEIAVWDLERDALVFARRVFEQAVDELAFGEGGRELLARDASGTVKRIRIDDGAVSGSFEVHAPRNLIRIHLPSRRLTVVENRDDGAFLRSFGLDDGKPLREVPIAKERLRSAFLSRAGGRIAAWNRERGVTFHDASSGREEYSLPKTEEYRRWAARGDDFDEIVVLDQKLGVLLYGFGDAEPRRLDVLPVNWKARDLVFSSGGETLALWIPGRGFRLVASDGWRVVGEIPFGSLAVKEFYLSDDGRRFVVTTAAMSVDVFDAQSGKLLYAKSPDTEWTAAEVSTRDGRLFLGDSEGRVLVDGPAASQVYYRIAASAVTDLELTPDERAIAVASKTDGIAVLDLASREIRRRLPGTPGASLVSVRFVGDGGSLAFVGRRAVAREGAAAVVLGVWDLTTGEAREIELDGVRHWSLGWDETAVLTTDDNRVRRVSLPDGKVLGEMRLPAKAQAVSCAALPWGRALIADSDARLHLVDLATREEIDAAAVESTGELGEGGLGILDVSREGDVICGDRASRRFVVVSAKEALRVGRWIEFGEVPARGFDASASGDDLIAVDEYGTVFLFHRRSATRGAAVEMGGIVRARDLSPDGLVAAAIGVEIKVLDLRKMAIKESFETRKEAEHVRFAEGGRALYWLEDDGTTICRRELASAKTECRAAAEIDRDRNYEGFAVLGNRVVVGSKTDQSKLVFIDGLFGAPILETPLGNRVRVGNCASARDGSSLACTGGGDVVVVSADGAEIARFENATTYAPAIALDAAGRRLSVADGRYCRIFDVPSKAQIARIQVSDLWSAKTAFGGGRYLVSMNATRLVQGGNFLTVWDAATLRPIVSSIPNERTSFDVTADDRFIVASKGSRLFAWPLDFSSVEGFERLDYTSETARTGLAINGFAIDEQYALRFLRVVDVSPPAAASSRPSRKEAIR